MPPKEYIGTWEEIAEQAAEFAGRSVRLIVLPEPETGEPALPLSEEPAGEAARETVSGAGEVEIPPLEDLDVLLARLREQNRQKIASFTDPAEAEAYRLEQERHNAVSKKVFAAWDAAEKISGPPLTDPYEIAFGEIVEEKMRKQGMII